MLRLPSRVCDAASRREAGGPEPELHPAHVTDVLVRTMVPFLEPFRVEAAEFALASSLTVRHATGTLRVGGVCFLPHRAACICACPACPRPGGEGSCRDLTQRVDVEAGADVLPYPQAGPHRGGCVTLSCPQLCSCAHLIGLVAVRPVQLRFSASPSPQRCRPRRIRWGGPARRTTRACGRLGRRTRSVTWCGPPTARCAPFVPACAGTQLCARGVCRG